jgi:uncharacterized protein DUF3237
MELKRLVDVEFRYQTMAMAGPSPRAGRMFGSGDATFSGERLEGKATWANFPRVLSDGSTRPDASGALTTPDGATVLFRVGGNGYPQGGRAVHVLTFEVDDERYSWLNDVVAVGEGSVDTERGVLRMRYYECTGASDPGF